jgi:carbonic anhydrase/acetyltransferase-like protein (isoleucine patch superfamily)
MTDRIIHRAELVHATAFIAPGAVVVGNVTLEQDASVWFNAVLRGDTDAIRIGRGSNVQDGAVLHADPGTPCIIGNGVTVGHRAIVHGAQVGDNVVVGMGSIILNRAMVGENSIIAAGAIVTEDMVIPPGSLVMGVPAKVRRPVTEEEIGRNRWAAEHYVANAKRYGEEGE